MTLLLALLAYLWLRRESRLLPGEEESERVYRVMPLAYWCLVGIPVLLCMAAIEAVFWIVRLS